MWSFGEERTRARVFLEFPKQYGLRVGSERELRDSIRLFALYIKETATVHGQPRIQHTPRQTRAFARLSDILRGNSPVRAVPQRATSRIIAHQTSHIISYKQPLCKFFAHFSHWLFFTKFCDFFGDNVSYSTKSKLLVRFDSFPRYKGAAKNRCFSCVRGEFVILYRLL